MNHIHRSIVRRVLTIALVVALAPFIALAQPMPPQPVDQPPEFAAVRARFEQLTPEEIAAAGYEVPPICVTAAMSGLPAELGAMGFHAENRQEWERQFFSGIMDPQTPPILLLDAQHRVVGLEWEAKDLGQPAPVLFGQTVELQPGHPGVPEPHYMLHAYFRPQGQVLFAPWDPQLICPPAAEAPPILPATGMEALGGMVPLILSSAGTSLVGLGLAIRVIRRRRF